MVRERLKHVSRPVSRPPTQPGTPGVDKPEK
jgi:hypothetical protein